ncbi:MAG: TonB family protein [Flavobacteriia bacterium]|nr:TonB family protein [Flavobacteriia bacterium]
MKKSFLLFVSLLFVGILFSQEIKPPKVEASYTGGSEAMTAYLVKNVKYPKGKTLEGIVYVEFLIDTDGKISHAKVMKGIDPELDKIALDAISKMPNWVPAKDDKNQAVKSKMVLPIKFKK